MSSTHVQGESERSELTPCRIYRSMYRELHFGGGGGVRGRSFYHNDVNLKKNSLEVSPN